ncbi:hypothetical protein HDU97_006398 [Phlyctochytrium planicorne]|nr:hypothetical protein HDU97_006398 [Phlyctochytrium planicorne]
MLSRVCHPGKHALKIRLQTARKIPSLSLRGLGVARQSSSVTPAAQKLPETFNKLIDLQTELGESSSDWVNRVANASRELEEPKAPFLITVVGEKSANKETLIDALLDANVTAPLAGDLFDAEHSKVVRSLPTSSKSTHDRFLERSYGKPDESSPSTESSTEVQRLKAATEWIQNYNVEFASCSADSHSLNDADDALYGSDLLVLVTDAVRPLSTASEIRLLERFYARGKQNFVIAVNNVEHLDGTAATLDALVSFIQRRLADVKSGMETTTETNSEVAGTISTTTIPIFPMSAKRARNLQTSFAAQGRSTNGPDFTTHWTASGVQDLKTSILSRVSAQNRSQHRVASVKFTAAESLRRILADQEASLELLASAKARIRSVLVPGLVAGEERLYSDFEKRELPSVEENLAELTNSLRSFFSGFGLPKLLFKSNNLSEDVKNTMRANSLLKIEYQMTYSIGKLNEGLYTLYERTRAELQAITSDSSPLSAYKLTKSFQSDVSRIIAIIDKQRPLAGVEVDPFTLRNLIATFDESNQADKLEQSAEAVVRRHLGLQFFILSGGVFGTYLGVPWAISIPSTAIVCGLGVGLMSLNWRMLQDRFISNISDSQKRLQSKLMASYDRDFKRVVAEPLAAIVKLVEENLEMRVREGEEARQRTEELLKLVEGKETKETKE